MIGVKCVTLTDVLHLLNEKQKNTSSLLKKPSIPLPR